MKRKILLSAALILSLSLVACGPDTTPGTIVASVGGTVTASNQASLTIPAGGLSADSAVLLTPATPSAAAPAGMTLVAGSGIVVSGEGGATLTQGTLTLPYDPAALSALALKAQATPEQLRLYQLIQGVWQQVQGTPDVDTLLKLFRQIISSFGTYALFVPTAPPAQTLASISLNCTATTLTVGGNTTCTATGKDSSGAALATQPSFTFTSSTPATATVNGRGQVSAVAAGSTNITATSGSVTSNAVSITVNTTSGGGGPQVITTGAIIMTDISRGGTIYLWSVEGNAEVARIIKNGTSTNLPAMPGGYAPSPGYNPYDRPCVDDDGNLTTRTDSTATGTRVWKTHHYDFASNTYSEIPLSTQDPVVVTCKSGKVLLSASSGSRSPIQAYTWRQGDAALNALPAINAGTCVGCNAVDTNWQGKTLYSTGLLNDGTFTPHGKAPFMAQRLMPDGSALGMESQAQLDTWTPGSTPTVLPGQPVTFMTLLDVNDNGDILAASAGSVSWQWRLWIRKGSIWTEIQPGAGNAFVNNASYYLGLTNDGRALVKVADASTSMYKAMMLY